VECEYFTLEMLSAISNPVGLDTKGASFHAITVIEGRALLKAGDERVELDMFQTAVVPAQVGRYQFQPLMECRALKSSV
jgi:mannose-6-phosphate isomerase class I